MESENKMNWIKLSIEKPKDKQFCLVKTIVQLDLFCDEQTCLNNSIYYAIYYERNDSFCEVKTNKKIKNPKCWSPL